MFDFDAQFVFLFNSPKPQEPQLLRTFLCPYQEQSRQYGGEQGWYFQKLEEEEAQSCKKRIN